MASKASLSYRDTGVVDNTELGLRALLKCIGPTRALRGKGQFGHQELDIGFFASVVRITDKLGLALCTDGVGSKVLIAEMLGRYDTIGVDCVAMNVNDAICVGAEPISFLDYIAIEHATPDILEAIGRGLYRGAELANVAIVGGEISQIPEIVRGFRPGTGVDLVGMCVGVVDLDKVIDGKHVKPGDAIVGIRSSGVHSNGLTLARRALFDTAGFRPDDYIAELNRTVGHELLEPTHIYVKPILDLLKHDVPVRGLVNITSDGFLNLNRIDAKVGFLIDQVPPAQPIFKLIRESGNVGIDEMYRVFNMGIGFCVIAPNDNSVVAHVKSTLDRHGFVADVIGRVISDPKVVRLPEQGLIGEGDHFRHAT